MAHVKKVGTARNMGSNARPKYLGVKIQHGGAVRPGAIIIRQRGTNYLAGENVKMGKDFTLYSVSEGVVQFSTKRKNKFNGRIAKKKVVSVKTTK